MLDYFVLPSGVSGLAQASLTGLLKVLDVMTVGGPCLAVVMKSTQEHCSTHSSRPMYENILYLRILQFYFFKESL